MKDDCIFCKIAAGDAKSYKVYEDEDTVAFLNIFPSADFHTLVIPKEHYKDLFDIPEAKLLVVMKTVKSIVDLYKDKLGIQNLQVINSSGNQAQQDVFHLHFHILPRKSNDGQNIKWNTEQLDSQKAQELLNKLSAN